MQTMHRAAILLVLPLWCLVASGPVLEAQDTATSGRSVGSETAPIVVEVFSDFQCPYCKNPAERTLSRVREDYVESGKVRLVHHDFPLSMHAHAREAARYAAAADRIGKYQVVAEALFREQETWEVSGDIEQTLRTVLTADEVKRVHELSMDPSIDAGITRDIELGQQQDVHSTPTMIVRHAGQDYPVVGSVSYEVFRRLLDQLLAG